MESQANKGRNIRRLLVMPVIGVTALVLAIAWINLAKHIRTERVFSSDELSGLSNDERVELTVMLKVDPESFHMERLLRAGRLRGVDGRQVRMARVLYADLRTLAGYSWITDIRLGIDE